MNKPIKSTDKDALEKLRAKLESLEANQEEMKKRNQYFRDKGTMKGYIGMSDNDAAKIDGRIKIDYSFNKAPAPSWQIQNCYQEIRRIKERIRTLEAEQETRLSGERPTYNTDGLDFKVEENEEIERLQIIYPEGRVNNTTYRELRSHGFVFSRTNNAFQRPLNDNARRSAKRFIFKQHQLLKNAEAEM